MINPIHLKTLAVVLKTGSFAAAAKMLGYTPSAVSQQISALERQTRVPLFERGARSIRPTPAAEILASNSVEILSMLRNLEEEARALCQGRTGRLRIGSFPTASAQILPLALNHLRRCHPNIEVELLEAEPSELVPRVTDRELDLALVYRYDRVPHDSLGKLKSIMLMRDEIRLLMPEDHPLADHEIHLRDLEDATWISTTIGSYGTQALHRACASVGFTPRIYYRTNDYRVIQSFVRAGLGIAIVPALAQDDGPGLISRDILDLETCRTIDLVHRTDTTTPVLSTVEAFVSAVRELEAVAAA